MNINFSNVTILFLQILFVCGNTM